MRNSNSKETRRAVEAYVLEAIERRYTDIDDQPTARPIARAFERIKSDMKCQEIDYNGNKLMGAKLAELRGKRYAAAVSPYQYWYMAARLWEIEPSYYTQAEHIAAWLEETPEEAERYTSDQIEHQFAHMTAAAFERLYDRENTPHRIPTSEFKRILQEDSQEHYFFDRKVMKYHKQTMRDITVYGFFLITDKTDGKEHDCYRVESMQASDPESPRHLVTYFFDRETLKFVFPKEA